MRHIIQIHMTNQCNLKCEYCYIKQNSLSMAEDVLVKQLDKVQDLSNILSDCECDYDVTYFGGEPLLRLEDILKFDDIVCSGINVAHKFMQTNGILLTKEVKDKLDEKQIHIGISCDGCKDPNHKEIERIYSEKIVDMQPKMMVDGYNVKDLMTNVKYFFDLAGGTQQQNFYIDVSFVKDNVWTDDSIQELQKQLNQLEKFIVWVFKTYNYILKIGFIDRCFQNIQRGKREYICFAGKTGFSLTPTGVIYPCSRFFSANKYPLYDSKLDKWYYDNIEFVKNANTTYDNKCVGCKIQRYCNQGCLFSQIQNNGIVECFCEVEKIMFETTANLYQYFKREFCVDLMKRYLL